MTRRAKQPRPTRARAKVAQPKERSDIRVVTNWGDGYLAATVEERGGQAREWILGEGVAKQLGCRIPPPVTTICHREEPVAACRNLPVTRVPFWRRIR